MNNLQQAMSRAESVGGAAEAFPDRPPRPRQDELPPIDLGPFPSTKRETADEIEKVVADRAGKLSDARTAALADATAAVDRMAERIGQPRGVIRYADMSDAQEIADILMRVYARDVQTIVGIK